MHLKERSDLGECFLLAANAGRQRKASSVQSIRTFEPDRVQETDLWLGGVKSPKPAKERERTRTRP